MTLKGFYYYVRDVISQAIRLYWPFIPWYSAVMKGLDVFPNGESMFFVSLKVQGSLAILCLFHSVHTCLLRIWEYVFSCTSTISIWKQIMSTTTYIYNTNCSCSWLLHTTIHCFIIINEGCFKGGSWRFQCFFKSFAACFNSLFLIQVRSARP